jgi:uncharacterized Tic20 family protein
LDDRLPFVAAARGWLSAASHRLLAKREDSPLVSAHAKEALNFHLSLVLYSLLTIPLFFVLIGIPLFFLLAIGSVVLAILAALEASRGGFFHYPLCIHFIR